MGFTIHKEAPKTNLVTVGQGKKEITMGKEPTYESNPELYHYRPGTTEPELKPTTDGTVGADVVSKEPADKAGPVGAKEAPKPEPKAEPKPVAKKK